MDIWKFINSRDIREHLKSINYQFSSLEAAWLIWQSKPTSIREKHAAWQELIETMPDCEIEERHNAIYQPSLHQFLKKLMAIHSAMISEFKNSENAVYMYSYREAGMEEYSPKWNVFETYEACLESIANRQFLQGSRFTVRKLVAQHPEKSLETWLNADLDIWMIHRFETQDDIELSYRSCVFDGMWFEFPTPFKKGDILQRFDTDFYAYEDTPFVVLDITGKTTDAERWKWFWDTTDMTAYGYFQTPECGGLYGDCISNYMDLEVYRGELIGRKRVLRALSNYLKDKIGLELYSLAYRTILAEEYAKAFDPDSFTDEGLELAGLKRPKEA